MSSIILSCGAGGWSAGRPPRNWNYLISGEIFHGIRVDGRGVFTDKHGSRTYAGQCKDGYACGFAVLPWCSGRKEHAEHGPDGKLDGRYLDRSAWETDYRLYERGKVKDSARVYADGRLLYDGMACAQDDPRLLALIAQVAPVEVRPAAPAPTRHSDAKRSSDGSAGSFCRPAGACEGRGHRGAAPCRTPSLVAVRHNPTPAAMQRTTPGRVRGRTGNPTPAAMQRTTPGRVRGRTGGTSACALVHPDNRRHVHTKGRRRQLCCHAIPRALPHQSLADPQTTSVGPLAGLCSFCPSCFGSACRGSRG
jgi:hypothetical protein